jgi:hypothetical protein
MKPGEHKTVAKKATALNLTISNSVKIMHLSPDLRRSYVDV